MRITHDFSELDAKFDHIDKEHAYQAEYLSATHLPAIDEERVSGSIARFERIRSECHLARQLAKAIETLQRQKRTAYDLLGVDRRHLRRLACRYRLRQWWNNCPRSRSGRHR